MRKSIDCKGNSWEERSLGNMTDITGCRFTKLIALFPVYVYGRPSKKSYWLCLCDCGNDNFIVSGNSLRCGLTLSCGCLTRSVGEENVENILKENNIYFKAEYVFLDLKSNRDGYLRYDFAILDELNIPMRLIEFDGEQHARPIEHFGGENKFKIQQENDVLKNQYALSHNIPLVRIPYSKRDYINLDDILGDKYLIKKRKQR